MKKFIWIYLASLTTQAQVYKKPLVEAIKEKDLRTDMYQLAGDQFLGREAGTLDELKVSTWFTKKMQETGMQPAGEFGTYYQFFDMYRHQISPNSYIKIGGTTLRLWKDILVADVVNADFKTNIAFVGKV